MYLFFIWYATLVWNGLTLNLKRVNLKTDFSRKQSTQNFPKNEHFLHSGLRDRISPFSVWMQKIRTRKSPNTDTFHAAIHFVLWSGIIIIYYQLFSFEKIYSKLIVKKFAGSSLQTHHVDSTLKRRGNDRFRVVSTWNPRGVFVGFRIIFSYSVLHSLLDGLKIWRYIIILLISIFTTANEWLSTKTWESSPNIKLN